MRKLKILYLVIALLLALSAIVSCGGDSSEGSSSESDKVQITFVTSTGMEIGGSIVNKGERVKYPTPPMIPGMTFDSWDKMITYATEDTTVVAVYVVADQGGSDEKEELLVRFFDINGQIIFSENVIKGDTLSYIPEAPQVEGKAFIGWSEELGRINQSVDVYPIYEDLVSYEVSFYDYDGRWIEAVTVYKGEDVTPPQLERRGYNLIGWSQDLTSVNSSLDVYPIYELNAQLNVLDISNKINENGTCTLTFSVKGSVCFAGAQGKITVPNNFTIEEIKPMNDGLATRQEGNSLSYVFTSVSGENITSEVNLFSITVKCTDNTYFARLGVSTSMVFDQDFNNIGFGAVLGGEFYTSIKPKS